MMCILFLAIQPSSRYVLVAADNRDIFFGKETADATFWSDHPTILAGEYIVLQVLLTSALHKGVILKVERHGWECLRMENLQP